MKDITIVRVNCMYCDESFDLNTELCNDTKCSEYKSDYYNKHYNAIEDEEYDDFMDHMEVCEEIQKLKKYD